MNVNFTTLFAHSPYVLFEKRTFTNGSIMHNHVARIINDGDADQTRDTRIAVINRERFHANYKQWYAINCSDRYRFIFVVPVYTSLSLANFRAVNYYRPEMKNLVSRYLNTLKLMKCFRHIMRHYDTGKYILTVNIGGSSIRENNLK